jgi:hypothetical protein
MTLDAKDEAAVCEAAADAVRPHVRALLDRAVQIDWITFEALRMNSREQEVLIPRLDDDALLRVCEHYLRQLPARARPFATYEDAIIGLLTPELMRRLRRTGSDSQTTVRR